MTRFAAWSNGALWGAKAELTEFLPLDYDDEYEKQTAMTKEDFAELTKERVEYLKKINNRNA